MPTQADLFRSFCDIIWTDAGNEHYHTWADAHTILEVLCAKPTGQSQGPGDDDMVEWLFHDGSTAWVTRKKSVALESAMKFLTVALATRNVVKSVAVNKAARLGIGRAAREGYALQEGSHPMTQPEAASGQITPRLGQAMIETLIDQHGLNAVLEWISEICSAKQEHIAANWQDRDLARAWGRAAYATASTANESSVLTVSP